MNQNRKERIVTRELWKHEARQRALGSSVETNGGRVAVHAVEMLSPSPQEIQKLDSDVTPMQAPTPSQSRVTSLDLLARFE